MQSKFPWVLDIRWTNFQSEVTYADILKEKYKDWDKEEDGRIDFLCVGFGDTIHLIELKRPKHIIKKKDLDQIRDYVAFLQSQLGNDPQSYTSVSGYLICGEVSKDPVVKGIIEMNKNNRIYVRKYQELLAVAERLHEAFSKKN